MYTANGPTVLQDGGTYTSVNGRVQIPDIRNTGGWYTDLYLRNDSPEYRNITVNLFNAGGYAGYVSCGLGANKMCMLAGLSVGSHAYVDGGEAVSIDVRRYRNSPQVYAIHQGISKPDYQVLLPLVHKYNYGWYSKVMIKNASTVADTATIWFQTSSGEVCPQSYYLSGNAEVTVDLRTVYCLANGYYGARIASSGGQQLAVVTTQELDANYDNLPEALSDYEGFANGAYSIVASSNLMPLLMRDNYGASASIMLQNPNNAANSISISYFNQAPGGWCCASSHTLGNYGVQAVIPLSAVPSGFVGSGKSTSNSGLPFNSIVNEAQSGGNQSMSYAASTTPTSKASVPVIWKDYFGWNTGLSLQNAGLYGDTIRVQYFDSYGNLLNSSDYSVPSLSSYPIFPLPLGNGTIGSAFIFSLGGQPISVVANQTNAYAGTSDAWMTSTGVSR